MIVGVPVLRSLGPSIPNVRPFTPIYLDPLSVMLRGSQVVAGIIGKEYRWEMIRAA